MSLNDPSSRPWGTARGAHAVVAVLWGLVALVSLVTAAFWVRMLRGDDDAMSPSLIGFNISIFTGVGALFADLWTAQRRQVEEGTAFVRFPGAWFIGAGTGALLASVFGGLERILALWAAVMFIGGIALYRSPNLLERSRARRAVHEAHVRVTGQSAMAMVTEVRTLFRNDRVLFRPTMTFTDRDGRQRWFTQTAPAGTRSLAKGQKFLLHYDAAHPERRRSLVVAWRDGR